MQFIANGPDIPDALLQAHEEGRVVFFCGAGISYPAGLPSFKGLVEQIYRLTGTVLKENEQEAFDRGQFDATLDLLERRLPDQRLAVRSKLAQALKPKFRRRGAIDTQAALLRLARNREGALRLVTTNFDHTFHVAAKRTNQPFQAYSAPMLPIPKNSRWDGLVYLHGLLSEELDETTLNRLVVTSGDFGLAYLTERWAARFVSELFRNYVVCFVGYSINDPVLRYMMDALAADRMLGESTPQAWALGDCELGQEHKKTLEWEAKGVVPILYNVPAGNKNHDALHHTLHAWADTYRDGVQGNEAIVVKYALAQPQDSTQQDDFVGRMLWALSDKSGLPAKRFADFNPVPPLNWLLNSFVQERFGHADLMRFGVVPHDEVDKNLNFSLIRRPSPNDRAPHMLLASGGVTSRQWDKVMIQIARWLLRHMNDPSLINWISECGGQLHEEWLRMIDDKLDYFASLERAGKTTELDEIRLYAPNAIPDPRMRTVWRLLLSNRVKSTRQVPDIYGWKERLKHEGLTTLLRLDLRDFLAPKLAVKKQFLWFDDDTNSVDEPVQTQLELVLTANQVHFTLNDSDDDYWKSALPSLLEDFQQLLRDALDLFRELGMADDRYDRSHWDLPSISPHSQNRWFRDWVSLIELLRDSWLAIRANDSERAPRIVEMWFDLPYPTFKRLALFAASHDDCIPSEQWVDWLLTDGSWWLWSPNTGREVFRLLVLQGKHLSGSTLAMLEAAILAGPPREMYRDDLEADRWQDLVAHSIWLHLAKLKASGCMLGETAAAHLVEVSSSKPEWKLEENERDEFSHWMSGTGDRDFDDSRDIDIAPRKRHELVQWLKRSTPEQRLFDDDTWREVCQTRFFHSLAALCDLVREDEWPVRRWREALQAWAGTDKVIRSWRYAAPLVLNMPNSVLQEIAPSLTRWMEAASTTISCHESVLLELCSRVLALPIQAGKGARTNLDGIDIYNPVGTAINHPVGHVTQVLINLWVKRKPNDNDLLPADLKPIFTRLCDAQIDRFRHGRVLLGSRLITFFRVDRSWSEQNLLPLFDWRDPVEAKAVWEGFLWSPRLYQPLQTAFKSQFLDCAKHYTDLGEHRQQFAALLIYAALSQSEGYTAEEFRRAVEALPQEGIQESAQALYQALAGAGDQREDYWKNRILPFWHKVWPKSSDLATRRLAEPLTRLVIAARDEFPAALALIQDWLQPIEYPGYTIQLLYESELCKRFPPEALLLLNKIIDDQQRADRKLSNCLDEIVQSAPDFVRDVRYQRLIEHARLSGV